MPAAPMLCVMVCLNLNQQCTTKTHNIVQTFWSFVYFACIHRIFKLASETKGQPCDIRLLQSESIGNHIFVNLVVICRDEDQRQHTSGLCGDNVQV